MSNLTIHRAPDNVCICVNYEWKISKYTCVSSFMSYQYACKLKFTRAHKANNVEAYLYFNNF